MGFSPIATINLLSLKRRRDSDFKKNFAILWKELNTYKRFPYKDFSFEISL